jgi:hypothetical protein
MQNSPNNIERKLRNAILSHNPIILSLIYVQLCIPVNLDVFGFELYN